MFNDRRPRVLDITAQRRRPAKDLVGHQIQQLTPVPNVVVDGTDRDLKLRSQSAHCEPFDPAATCDLQCRGDDHLLVQSLRTCLRPPYHCMIMNIVHDESQATSANPLTSMVNIVYYTDVVGRPKVRADRLDERSIVDAALTVARHRVADLTMRSVADELQVSVGAVYKHLAGRDALIALVVEEILGQAPPMAPDAGDGWLALRAQVLGIQALVDRYPGLDQVVIAHSPTSPTANELRREGMAALQKEGLTLDEAHRVYRSVTWLWLGSRVALQGRARTDTDIDTFADALDILISGLKQEIGTPHQRDRVADRTSTTDRRS